MSPLGLEFPFYSPLYRGTRNANILRKGWPRAVSAADLEIPGSGRKILVPKLSDIAISSDTGSEVTALVDMATVGKTARELERRIETVTASLHAYQTKVERIDPARARITVLFSPPPRPHYDPDTSTVERLDLESFPIYLDPTTQDASLLLTKSTLIGGESECVSGKTRIYLPLTDEHVTIEQLAKKNRPITVLAYSTTTGQFIPTIASTPYLKGYADLYSVEFEDGAKLDVTNQHRFLTPQGWRRLDDLRAGQLVASAPHYGVRELHSEYAWVNPSDESGRSTIGRASSRQKVPDGSHLPRPNIDHVANAQGHLPSHYDTVKWVRIRAVNLHLRDQPFYDLHVPIYNSYVAEGIIHHNSGKSNLVWYLLSQLNTHHIPYRLWVIDPAGGVEMNDLEHSPNTRQYIDRAKHIPTLVQHFRQSMDRRLEAMKKRGQRRHFPTPQEPLEICIIDELLLCKSQLSGGDAASPLGEVLTVGRKALHIVWGCSQLGEKAVIGQIRDLFPQRICLRTRSRDITDAVLGSNATVDGAVCHRITQRGEGYVFTDSSQMFEKFHAPLVRETLAVAQGGTTVPTTPAPSSRVQQLRERRRGRTFLYQFFPDTLGGQPPNPNHPQYNRPCYVGITDNPRRRFKEHEKKWPAAYWSQIDHRRTKIIAFPTWQQAKDMETDLINYYQPLYNVQERSA